MNTSKSKVWVKLIEECKNSGLSQAGFCSERGLKLATFYGWKARLKKRGLLPEPKKNKASKPSRFLEAIGPGTPELSPEPTSLTLKVNEQFSLKLEKGFDEVLLVRTLKVLAKL